MTSLQTRIKQIPANDGYYITVADARNTFYTNIGTDSAPSMSIGPLRSSMSSSGAGVSSLIGVAGGVFRDMGKTVISTGRVFRKVQLLVSTNVTNGPTEGVAGAAATVALPVDYLTGFIELPGTGGLTSGSGSFTPVARLG